MRVRAEQLCKYCNARTPQKWAKDFLFGQGQKDYDISLTATVASNQTAAAISWLIVLLQLQKSCTIYIDH